MKKLFLILFLLIPSFVFGLLAILLSAEVWSLFKLGLGGYIGSRTLEKIVTTIKG